MSYNNLSSISTSNGRQIPRYGCNQVMKMWVENTMKNSKRKFRRCRNRKKIEISCNLFIWDYELDEIEWKCGIKTIDNSLVVDCNKGEDMIGYMKDFGKEFRKEFGKEYA
ncbi:uncharacterized protein LOC131626295 [Vicia villosa]|uniref:uncharacterized protein LOC131626295 n=1 Tax=Vicia villosa TaxID=3911 RepID=UPI00273C6E03|nr:uncharacterized protein LOC131626295 [Vicia villosa]